MRKLLTILFLFVFANSFSQTLRINKFLVDSMLSPNHHILYFDSSHVGDWQPMATRAYADSHGGGGGGGQLLTIGSPLTGTSYDGTAPVTIGIDTTIVATRAYVGNNIPLTIYTGDGSLSGDRIITLDGHSLRINDGSVPMLSTVINGGDRQTVIEAFKDIGDGNDASVNVFANNSLGQFRIDAFFNADDEALIVGSATSGTSAITYTADTHTFNGSIIGANLATGGSAPTTSGTRQGLIADTNGLLSFTNKTFAALTFGATTTWNYLTGFNKTLTLTGDANLVFSNTQDGDQGTLIVIQDGSGGHALTVPDQVVSINTGVGDTTVLGFIVQNGVYSGIK